MSDEQKIIKAVLELSSQNGDKKPHVSDVEAFLGYQITAAQRNAAWAAIRAKDSNEPLLKKTAVKNCSTTALAVSGVVIPAGKSVDIEDFNADHDPFVAAWIKARLLVVG